MMNRPIKSIKIISIAKDHGKHFLKPFLVQWPIMGHSHDIVQREKTNDNHFKRLITFSLTYHIESKWENDAVVHLILVLYNSQV